MCIANAPHRHKCTCMTTTHIKHRRITTASIAYVMAILSPPLNHQHPTGCPHKYLCTRQRQQPHTHTPRAPQTQITITSNKHTCVHVPYHTCFHRSLHANSIPTTRPTILQCYGRHPNTRTVDDGTRCAMRPSSTRPGRNNGPLTLIPTTLLLGAAACVPTARCAPPVWGVGKGGDAG